MGKFWIVIIVLIAFVALAQSCGDETTSYYIDRNGNGREDFGEGVWYEDGTGTHFYD